MVKSIAIVGAGINGLLTAFLVSDNLPDARIDIYDAENRPGPTIKHNGVTHGSKDARHITGSESIGFENSIHKDALRNTPTHITPGWLLKEESQLSNKEKAWRDKFEDSYIGSEGLNDLDYAHAELNYKGLAAWHKLAEKYPFIRPHIITTNGVDVYFRDKTAYEDDLVMETEFCNRYFNDEKVKTAYNQTFANLYSQKLIVPGICVRVKSLAIDLLNRLEKNSNIHFYWGITVKNAAQLDNEVVIWTAGVTHEQPVEYLEHNVQGIVGCWITIPNTGHNKPFKIATPTPSAYINFTPDGKEMHISGGFGWTGEYADISKISLIAKPMAEHFVSQINKYLGTNITYKEVDLCIRSSTPTGQPLLLTESSYGKRHIFITGSAKSGTTHAPILAAYAMEHIS